MTRTSIAIDHLCLYAGIQHALWSAVDTALSHPE